MAFPNYKGRSLGFIDCETYLYRELFLECERKELWGKDRTGCFMIAKIKSKKDWDKEMAYPDENIAHTMNPKFALVAYVPYVYSSTEINGRFMCLPIYKDEPCGDSDWCWKWDGNIEKPTLTGSIQSVGSSANVGWHGYLQNGDWIGC